MTTYVRLYPRQTDSGASLFRIEDQAARKLVLRPDLKLEACSRCGKFDETRALTNGSYNRMPITIKQDFVSTWEHFPIVSGRVRQFLDSIVGDAVTYFDAAKNSDHFIALPVHVLLPDANSDSFRASNKCAVCGRYSELLWGANPVTLNSDITIGVFYLENRMGITPVCVVSKVVSVALTKVMPKFKGFLVDPLTSVARAKN